MAENDTRRKRSKPELSHTSDHGRSLELPAAMDGCLGVVWRCWRELYGAFIRSLNAEFLVLRGE